MYKFILKYLNACINLIKKLHGTSKNKNKGMREVACRSNTTSHRFGLCSRDRGVVWGGIGWLGDLVMWQVGCELALGGGWRGEFGLKSYIRQLSNALSNVQNEWKLRENLPMLFSVTCPTEPSYLNQASRTWHRVGSGWPVACHGLALCGHSPCAR